MLHTFIGENEADIKEVRAPMYSYLKTNLGLHRNLAQSRNSSVGQEFTSADEDALLQFAFDRYFNGSSLFGTSLSCGRMLNRLNEIEVDEACCLVDFGINPEAILEGIPYIKRSEGPRDGVESSTLVTQISEPTGSKLKEQVMFESLIRFRYSFRKFYSSKVYVQWRYSRFLGIGANTALFSIVKAVFFHALPVRDSSSLVAIKIPRRFMQGTSYLNYKSTRGAAGIFPWDYLFLTVNMGLWDRSERRSSLAVLRIWFFRKLFSFWVVQPVLGRSFLPEEDQVDDAVPVAVVSYGLWQRRFGGKKDILPPRALPSMDSRSRSSV